MEDPFRVGGLQRVADLNAQIQQFVSPQRFARDTLSKRLALQQFHDDVGPVFVPADVVDRADVWMVQGRCGARLSAKSIQRLMIGGVLIGEELQGDVAAESSVFGPVDHTHAAAAERIENSIMLDGAADHVRGRL